MAYCVGHVGYRPDDDLAAGLVESFDNPCGGEASYDICVAASWGSCGDRIFLHVIDEWDGSVEFLRWVDVFRPAKLGLTYATESHSSQVTDLFGRPVGVRHGVAEMWLTALH